MMHVPKEVRNADSSLNHASLVLHRLTVAARITAADLRISTGSKSVINSENMFVVSADADTHQTASLLLSWYPAPSIFFDRGMAIEEQV